MPAQLPDRWDREVDVVVLGSGAAGLPAAILAHDSGAKVLLLEKAPQLGGTTGISGGMPWVPLNKHMAEVEVTDSREEALTYIRRLTMGKHPDDALLDVYVDTAAEMIDYLETHTPMAMYAPTFFADYYGDMPGGKPRGRSIEGLPFDASQLGEWAEKLRRSPIFPPMTMEEGGLDPAGLDFNMIAERYEKDVRTMGGALVASLFKGLLDRGVETLLETAGRELVLNASGEVIGIRAEREGRDFYAGARRGVVIATGGFEWNRELVKAFLKGEVTHPLTPPYNEGDGLIMAMEAGASLGNMSEAWWYPAMRDPTMEYDGKPLNHLGGGRMMAGSIIVNKHGKRFVNEGVTYMDLPKSFYVFDQVAQEFPNLPPVWMIFDRTVKDKAVIITMMPGEDAPDWVDQAPTLRELAKKIGVDADGLEATVERFNRFAAEGVDPDFHRGTFHFEGFTQGGADPSINLGPIEQPPYYAQPIYYGTLGTNGGPRINEHAQVKNHHGGIIPGLYCAGNAAAGVFGPAYPGGGATIGPAMTFGYLAGKAVAQETPRALATRSGG